MSKQKNKKGRERFNVSSQFVRSWRTSQEEQLNDFFIPTTSARKNRRPRAPQNSRNDTYEEQEQVLNVSIGELKDSKADKMSAVINQLIAKNKINAKNAFEVPMIDLNGTTEFDSLTGDNNWKKISSNLESNNKIYGYRVDATHSQTYKVLEMLTRKQHQNKSHKEEGGVRGELEKNFMNFYKEDLPGDQVLFKYLQKNYKGINIVKLELYFNSSPILDKKKRSFDQQGLTGLLLNNLDFGKDLALQFDFQDAQEEQTLQNLRNPEKLQISEEQFSFQPLWSENIFSKIYNFCIMNDLLQKEPEQTKNIKRQHGEIQSLWAELEQIELRGKSKRTKPSITFDPNPSYINRDAIFQPVRQENVKTQQNASFHANLSLESIQLNRSQPLVIKQEQMLTDKAAQTGQQEKEPVSQKKEVSIQHKSKHTSNQEREIMPQNQSLQVTSSQLSQIRSQILPVVAQFSVQPSQNLSLPSVQIPKQIPISSEIRLSRNTPTNRTLPILREIQPEQQKESVEGDAVQRWRSLTKKSRVPRVPKRAAPRAADQVNFLAAPRTMDGRSKTQIISVDKRRKMQFKKFMKSVNTEQLQQNYLCPDTSKYNFDFQLKTLLREDQPFSQETAEQIPEVNQSNIVPDVGGNNTSNFIDLVNESNANLSRTVSIKFVKQRIQSFVFEDKIDSLQNIYHKFGSTEGYITPALCFLTLLHLANEHEFKLEAGRDDIKISEEKDPQ